MSSETEKLLEILDAIKSKGLRGVGSFLEALLNCTDPRVREKVKLG